MPTITTSTIAPLLAPGLKKVIFNKYAEKPMVYKRFFNTTTSRRAFEEWAAATGVGPVVEKPEGSPVAFKAISTKSPKRIVHVTYGLGMRATLEAKQDEQYGVMTRQAADLGRVFRIREEIEAANIFNMAFTTVLATTFDGKALCASDHPLTHPRFAVSDTDLTAVPSRTVSTASNVLSTPADLDYPALQDMMTLAMRTPNDEGDFIDLTPKTLLVPPELSWVAKELLGSQYRPDSANQVRNVARQDTSLEPVAWSQLLDSDAWFMVADKGEHDLMYFTRYPFNTRTEDEFATADTLIMGLMRISAGFGDWRGVWGTPGE